MSERLALGGAGDQLALESLVPFVYKELRDIARHHLQPERPRDTLQSTRLVREGYLRLVSQTSFKVENGGHFPGVSSHLMGQILGEYARSHAAARRGAEQEVDSDADCSWSGASAEAVVLDEALNQISCIDEQQGRWSGGESLEASRSRRSATCWSFPHRR